MDHAGLRMLIIKLHATAEKKIKSRLKSWMSDSDFLKRKRRNRPDGYPRCQGCPATQWLNALGIGVHPCTASKSAP